jgi:hypothetical protein
MIYHKENSMTEQTKPNRLPVEYLLGKLKETGPANQPEFNMEIFDPRYGHHFPYFNLYTARTMLLDPRIRYGLYLIKGPIATYTKFFNSEEADSSDIHTAIVELNYHFPYGVFCDNQETEEFIIDQLHRFWEVGLAKVLTSIEWGHSASEVRFKRNKEGKVCFDNLHLYPALSTQALVKNKGIVGFVRNKDKSTYVPIGKGFWHIHQREKNNYYGESALKGAHVPWHETWTLGGARDIRRTWFFKNAYDGGQLYYPEGSYVDSNGQEVANEELAVRLMEAKRSGSAMVFPATRDTNGKYDWMYEPAKASMTPDGMQQYIDQLRDEELEGLGIPPEVVQGDGGSIGSATGRMVPLMAFIASLTPICTSVVNDFCEQILPLLLTYNNMDQDYSIRRIVPKSPEKESNLENPLNPDRTPGESDDHKKKPIPNQKKTIQNNGKTG